MDKRNRANCTEWEQYDLGTDYYEQKHRERAVNNLQKKAQALGFELVAQSSAAECVSWERSKVQGLGSFPLWAFATVKQM